MTNCSLGIELPQSDESYGAGCFLENSKKKVKIIFGIQEPRSAGHEPNFAEEPMAQEFYRGTQSSPGACRRSGTAWQPSLEDSGIPPKTGAIPPKATLKLPSAEAAFFKKELNFAGKDSEEAAASPVPFSC
ncbi:uncharacterized protein GJ701_010831 [Geothlypis trichas]